MTEEQRRQLVIELINARRKRVGFKTMLKYEDIIDEHSVSYYWAEDSVKVFEKFLAGIMQ